MEKSIMLITLLAAALTFTIAAVVALFGFTIVQPAYAQEEELPNGEGIIAEVTQELPNGEGIIAEVTQELKEGVFGPIGDLKK